MNEIRDFFLKNMGVDSLQDVNEWFLKSRNDKFRVDGIDECIELMVKFKHKPVHVIGDYDVDGVSATWELVTMLKEAGFTNVSYRIPKRFSEGYGMNNKMIEEIDEGLIITCDNGIAAIKEIKMAKAKGLTVIVTDHHLPVTNEDGEIVYPDADIIIDPNAIPGSADFNGYCGAGIVYKICQRLFNNDMKILGKYQIMAAIATICDVMDLVSENYVIVKDGLNKIKYPYFQTTGFYALAAKMGVLENPTADSIGYKLGPAINAISRLYDDGGMMAVNYLLYNGPVAIATRNANWIDGNNTKRKELSRKGIEDAYGIIKETGIENNCPMTIYIPNLLEGIIGIVAGRICEDYNVPVVVFTDMEGGFLKGSGRAPEGFKLKENLDKVQNRICHYGGHDGAAGLTIKASELDAFSKELCEKADFFDRVKPDLVPNMEIKASEVKNYVEEQVKYEPFGKANPKPLIKISDAEILPQATGFIRFMGAKKDIVKLSFKGFDAISFNQAGHFKKEKEFNQMSMIGYLGANFFNGKFTPQVEFISHKVHNKEVSRTPLAETLRQKL